MIQYDNLEIIPFRFSQSDDLVFNITNPNGVLLQGMNLSKDLSDIKPNRTSSDTLFFPYLKTKNGNLHLIRPNSWNQDNTLVEFRLDDTSFDIGQAFGPAELVSQESIQVSKLNSRSSVSIEIVDNPLHLDKIRVFHPSGGVFDSQVGSRYDDLIFVESYFINDKPYTLDYGTFGSRIYVNADLEPKLIAQNISEIISNLKDTSIFGITMGSVVFINTRRIGDAYGELRVQVIESDLVNPRVKVNNEFTQDIIYADGGFLEKAHPILESGNAKKFESDLNTLLVRTNTGWSGISRICPVTDSIQPNLTPTEQASAISEFNTKETIELIDNEEITMNYNTIEIRRRFRPKVGVLSLFDIKDFDFSTYQTSYSRGLDLDLYKDYYVPANTKILDFTKNVYRIIGDGTIIINGITYTQDMAVNGVRTAWQDTDTISEYRIVTGNAVLVVQATTPYSNKTRLDIPYFDESNDAQNYTGPFSLKADHAIVKPDYFSYAYREKFLYGNVDSEYQVYLENYTKDFATDNRVTPYISKWALIDSLDSRDNPYRLNSDIMFGKDNFGPSHRETIPTPEKLTHEWFYIESDFNYSLDPNLLRSNFSYFNTPLDVDRLISEPGYFEEYFNYVPESNGVEVGRPQPRYSTLIKNQSTNQYETFFKGSLFRFYELDENLVQRNSTNRFEDYKFSVLLKPIPEKINDSRRPVNYRVIENIEAKALTVLIELAIGNRSQIHRSVYISDTTSPVNNLITQATLFGSSLQIEPKTYTIDRTITVNTLSDYNGMLSGQIQLGDAELGETVHLIFGDRSCIVSTQGSNVYSSIQEGIISNGDRLAKRVHAVITKPYVVLAQGTYQAAILTPSFQDGWNYGSSTSPTSGQIFVSGPNTAQTVYINNTSASVISDFEEGPVDESFKLSTLSTGDTFKLVNGSFVHNILRVGSISTSAGVTTINTTQAGGTLIVPSVLDKIMVAFDYFIPTVNDPNVIATTGFQVIHKQSYLDSMFGDYRVEFNESGVSNLTHSFLYYASSKKYNTKQSAFSTIKLSRGIDLSPNGVNLSTSIAQSVRLPGLEDYDSFAYSEIEQVSQEFAPMYIIKPGDKYVLVQTTSTSLNVSDLQNQNITTDGVLGASTDTITLSPNISTNLLKVISPSITSFGDNVTYSYSGPLVPFGTSDTWIESSKHFQVFGGVRYLSKIFELISFAKFVQILNLNSDLISWETYSNGGSLDARQLDIEILPADEITKNTMVQISEEPVQSGQINRVAGFNLGEVYSQEYDLNRYSGDYDVIFKPLAGFKYRFSINDNDLTGGNICLNPNVDNFFVLPNFEYIKFSRQTILDLENSENYSSVYPLIAETPIDRTNFNILSSSWDTGYHFEYSTKSSYRKVPGTRRVTEDYSFVSKLLNLPSSFIIEDYTSTPLQNQEFAVSQATEADIVYSRFGSEIRFKLNLPRLITRSLSNKGLRREFNRFFRYADGTQITNDSSFLGELNFEEFLSQYCLENLVRLYQVGEFEFYSLDDRTIADNSIVFSSVRYNQLNNLGYRLLRTVRINNTKSSILEGSVLIKPDTGISLVPKIKINFI